MRFSAMAISLAMVLAPAAAAAAAAEPEEAQSQAELEDQADGRAYIPFANRGGVQNWRAEGSEAIYFEDSHGRWYKAQLMGTAHDLPYAEQIGIDPGAAGRLDRFGAIYVDGRRFHFRSFERVDGPPSRDEEKA